MKERRPVTWNPKTSSTSNHEGERVKSTARKRTAKASPFIVGIGASAGGLEAFTQILGALPEDTGMAFVMVQHLEPGHDSILTKLLTKTTDIPVQEIRDRVRVEPNHVYVIPANADLSLRDGRLHIVGRKATAGHHLPIDHFFESLAETQGFRAIGVILSGTGSDGTAGLRAIKAKGGVTFAQQPESAKFDGMPRSAIAAGCVDLVMPPERIAGELARISRNPLHPLAVTLPIAEVPTIRAHEEDWARLFRLLRTAHDVDFTCYKKPTIKRRLARRMAATKTRSLGEYLKILEGSRKELDELFREFLLLVTSFFRDPEVFSALKNEILRRILKAKGAQDAIRVWVPGCSTGEEVYSIAICLVECLGNAARKMPIQIYGTDVSDESIEKARAGVYPRNGLRKVSPQRLRRFFMQSNGGYQVNPDIRELCVFAHHDVTKDPPFSRLDLISCRNVLIYFEPTLQKKVLTAFHYALNSGGFLLLGKSESLGGFADLFSVVDRKRRFFVKSKAATVPLQVAPDIRPAFHAGGGKVVGLDRERHWAADWQIPARSQPSRLRPANLEGYGAKRRGEPGASERGWPLVSASRTSFPHGQSKDGRRADGVRGYQRAEAKRSVAAKGGELHIGDPGCRPGSARRGP